MSNVGDLIFLAFAFALGMVIYTSFIVTMYYIFLRETPEETIDITPDTQTVDEATSNMEEISIDDI